MSKRATQLHNTAWQGVFYLTGGGSQLISELLTTAGASATVLEASVPYASSALNELLGRPPEQAASETTALQLAVAAFERAQHLGEGDLFGFGCTASLATNREKKGTHRAHWAIQTAQDTHVFSATYSQDRPQEEALLLEQMWWSLMHLLCAGESPIPNGVAHTSAHASEHLQRLLAPAPQRYCSTSHDGLLILPGSFNPLHAGHQQMLRAAEEITAKTGAYELAIRNADKHSLDYVSLERRLANITQRAVWLTNAPMFEEKARLFPGTMFAVGVDTMARIGALRFYNNRVEKLEAAIKTFSENSVSFLVFGRLDNGAFVRLDQLDLPTSLRVLCRGVPESDFRNDLSSSAWRAQNT